MPNTSSAKKALRQSIRRKVYNNLRKNKYKTLVKNFRKAITSRSLDDAKNLMPKIYKAVDKAAKGNTIKYNKASRIKSRLSSLLNQSMANK